MGNEQRNTYVRRQITQALVDMLQERKLDSISVKELCEQAQVGRVSFYRNFDSRENVLRAESDRLLAGWGNAFEGKPDQEYNAFFLSLFDFYRANRRFYTTLARAGLDGIILQTFLDTAKIAPETPNLEAYLKSFWAYGIYGWTVEWMRRGMTESGEELFALFAQLQGQKP